MQIYLCLIQKNSPPSSIVTLLHYITPTTHFVAVISGSVLYDSNRMCCVGAIRQPQFHPHGRHGNKAVYGDGLELELAYMHEHL